MTTTLAVYTPKSQLAVHRWISIVLGCLFLLALSTQPIALQAQTYTDLHDFMYNVDGAYNYYSGIYTQGTDGNLYGTTYYYGPTASYGTVVKITPSGNVTVLYNFTDTTDGGYPIGGLTLGADGNFYGTTITDNDSGKSCYYGTVYKISASGKLTTLHCFTDVNGDGYYPYSPPVVGKKGLYGVTSGYSAYTITSSGAYKSLGAKLPGPSYAPLLLANDGNLYGTTYTGGNPGYGTIFKLSTTGAVTIIHNFDYTNGGYPLGGLVQGSDGNLYGTTYQGGTATNPAGTIFKVSLKGGGFTVLKNFDSQSSDGGNPYAGLVAGSDGNFYGATYTSSGTPYGTLFKITKGGTYSVLNIFDYYHGAYNLATPMQHTNGNLYSATYEGGANAYGVFWSLNNGMSKFCSIVGYAAGTSGTKVQILGQGFNSASAVKFGSGSATFTVTNDNYLTATVPTAGTTGNVTVTESGGTLTCKQQYKVLPVLTSFNPTSGPVGTQVTITGSGFIGTKTVTFNGVKATGFTVNNAGTSITVNVPSGATTGKIKITTPGGTATSSGPFTVT